jgi:hypothetical protein
MLAGHAQYVNEKGSGKQRNNPDISAKPEVQSGPFFSDSGPLNTR